MSRKVERMRSRNEEIKEGLAIMSGIACALLILIGLPLAAIVSLWFSSLFVCGVLLFLWAILYYLKSDKKEESRALLAEYLLINYE